MRTKDELKKAHPKLVQLIDTLWREYYGLYSERYRFPDDLDEAGDPIDPWKRSFVSRDIRHGQALGQDNLVEGNRSIAIGQSNTNKLLLEIVCGVYATEPESNATEWVPADRLFTVGNGLGPSLRNDALTIYKSGYSVFTNALLVGDYDHRDELGFLIDPLNGTLRFTTADKYQFWDVDHWASLGGAGSYTLPIATGSILGGIKVGTNLSIDGSGVLSSTYSYTLPVATASVLGGVKQGSGVSIAGDGTISVSAASGTVTDFSASGISGVFTTSVATSTTTPALSFALVSKNANRVFASPNGAAGVPSFRQIEIADINPNGSTPSSLNFLCGDGTFKVPTGGTGTVTSVAMSVPTGFSISGTPITTSGTLAVTMTAGYFIPTTTEQTNWNTAYTNRIATFTTTGSSGAATFSGNTLNIPTYTLTGLGGIGDAPSNGTTYGRLNGAWSAITAGTGTVTSVAMSVPTGFNISGTPITTSGTLAVTMAAGYFIPTTTEQTNWNEAYANMGKVAFHDNFTLIGYLNSSNFSIAGGVISLKLKTINSTSLIGIGDLSLQPTLTSGTNIKTINGNSILGSGDITITGGTNYWQQGTGYIAPATLGDEVRIGAITDFGDYKLQVSGGIRNQDAFYTDGLITLIHHENTTNPNRVINLHATATQGWSYSRECAIGFNTPPTASSDATIESGLFTNYLNTAGVGSRTSYFKWYVLHNDALTNTMTLNNLGDLSVTGKLTAASTILSSGGAIGYATGAGSTATQGTSKATAVTCNALCGQIPTFSAALAAAAEATFVVNNSQVLAGDIILVNHVSGGTTGAYLVSVTAVASGSFTITYSNVSTASKTEAPVFRFAIFRAVTA